MKRRPCSRSRRAGPSVWYLRLAGEIARAFHGQVPLPSALPVHPGPPWPGADGKPSLFIASAASFSSKALAPEAVAVAGGITLAPATEAANLPLPTSLAGTQLTVIDSTGVGRPAPLFYASPTQVNFQVPAGTALGSATLLVSSAGSIAGSGGGTVAPGIFSAGASGQGVAAAEVVIARADGTQSSSLVFSCSADGKCVPSPIGLGTAGEQAILFLYGTGIRGRTAESNVSCTIGGIDAPIQYAAAQGTYAGSDQVNILLPRGLAGAGEVAVRLTVDGELANSVVLSFR
jgi:uncharacterized protein (TIGR03437 family)